MQNVCAEDGYWPETQVNSTAVIRCSSLAVSHGELYRFCGVFDGHPQWYDVQGECLFFFKLALGVFVSAVIIGVSICCIIFLVSVKRGSKNSPSSSKQ